MFSGCQGCVEYQTSSLIFMVWGRCLKMGHTSYDMPCPSLVWDHHTTLLPGLRFVLLILGSFPLHPAYWNPLHLSRPSTSKKTSSTFPSPRAGCSALFTSLSPTGPGHVPSKFPLLVYSQLRLFLACSVTSASLRKLLLRGFPALRSRPTSALLCDFA